MKRTLYLFCSLILSLSASAQCIGPLIDAPWGQREPFNQRCPLYDGKHAVDVGCVATALTQIMAYYRYPECTVDTLFGWQTDHVRVDTIMPGATIDWDNIVSDYRGAYTDAQADAVAWLSLYAATAAKMNFGPSSSGAHASHYVTELPRAFGYKSCIECDRAFYTQDAWRRLIINEMECGRPVLYTAHNMTFAGHAFVVDGYDYATGRFHVNWGYDGTFDKWVDIDVMGQFEHPDDLTFWGLREGLYNNHCALLIHPTDEIRPAADSIVWHEGDVTVDAIVPRRHNLRTGGYELVDIHLTSHRPDTIAYTFEMLSNAPSDTALFEQADYVALGCAILYPHSTQVFTTSAQFNAVGDRVLRLSNDDEALLCPTPVTVAKGQHFKIAFDDTRILALSPREASFAVDISTEGADYAGTLVTYCLFPEGSDEDLRHWQVIGGDAPATLTDTVTFRCLEPSTTYTLKVRWPWDVRQETTFTTPPDIPTDLDDIHHVAPRRREPLRYDLSGRRLMKGAKTPFVKK